MELIKVLNVGYGFDGKTLDLTVAVIQGATIKGLYVANQNDVTSDNECFNSKNSNINYISKYDNLFIREKNNGEDATIIIKKKVYDVYTLNSSPTCKKGTEYTNINVSQNDLTFIKVEIEGVQGKDIKELAYNKDCCADKTYLIFPLYNLLALRLNALSAAQFIGCNCNIPSEFIDKILQIEAIELATHSGEYYKAATYWNKFYKGKSIVTTKNCGCHG